MVKHIFILMKRLLNLALGDKIFILLDDSTVKFKLINPSGYIIRVQAF